MEQTDRGIWGAEKGNSKRFNTLYLKQFPHTHTHNNYDTNLSTNLLRVTDMLYACDIYIGGFDSV